MEGQALTELLTTLLIVAVIILVILITIFIIIYSKSKKQEKTKKNKSDIKLNNIPTDATQNSKTMLSNIVQTKTYTTENIKNFMDFTEIKDNMILQKDGKKFIMIIQCKGVNYDLMSSIEKSGVEQGFAQFLNTLTKPIQIYVQARKVNLEESLERYNKRLQIIEKNFHKAQIQYDQAQKKGDLNSNAFKNIRLEYVKQRNLYEYTKDIIANTERLSLNQNILTKNYYIAISYSPENANLFNKDEIMEMAFSELYTNAQAMLGTLSVCGVTGKVLDSVELADLLYVSYNRDSSELYDVDTAIKSGYDALYTTAPDIVSKKIEHLDQIIDERAQELAFSTINKVELRSAREKELKQKENNMEELIKELAKSMILENEANFPKEIIKESINEIEKDDNGKETKKAKTRKGA